MRTRYIRNRPSRSEELRALLVSSAVAAATGVVTFYFARMLIAREALPTKADTPAHELTSGEG